MDNYGSNLRDKMKESMKEPARDFRRLNVKQDSFDSSVEFICWVVGFCIILCFGSLIAYHVWIHFHG